MLLRTKIFRYLVFFALIPSLAITFAAYYLVTGSVRQTGERLYNQSPEMIINSLRLAEEQVQLAALDRLAASEHGLALRPLDWRLEYHISNDSIVTIYANDAEMRDSLTVLIPLQPGPVRRLIGKNLILGYANPEDGVISAGGFILDSDYLDGYEAASASLSGSREYKNLLPAYRQFILVTGLLILAVIVGIAYIVSRRLSMAITTPLEALSASTALVSQGDLPSHIQIKGTEEISDLAGAFNRMITDLEQSRRRLIAVERVAAWQEFARRMAHELKNPLTPISLSLYRIRKRLEESGHYDDFAEALEAITAEVKHLERMATDYSSLAKLPEPKRTTFDFNGLVREVVALHQAQCEQFAFALRVDGEAHTVFADPDRLREVMVNILKNAFEFTPTGGEIIVATQYSDDQAAYIVTNENIDQGIDNDHLRSAKMPYYSTRPGGTGLGLAIAEKIILDHGGALSLHSQDDHTTVRFDIPRGKQENS